MLRDKEVDCREKEAEIRDLKEKVVKLSSVARQLETHKAELIHQLRLQVSGCVYFTIILEMLLRVLSNFPNISFILVTEFNFKKVIYERRKLG